MLNILQFDTYEALLRLFFTDGIRFPGHRKSSNLVCQKRLYLLTMTKNNAPFSSYILSRYIDNKLLYEINDK